MLRHWRSSAHRLRCQHLAESALHCCLCSMCCCDAPQRVCVEGVQCCGVCCRAPLTASISQYCSIALLWTLPYSAIVLAGMMGKRQELAQAFTGLLQRVKAARREPGVDEILLPGERGDRLAGGLQGTCDPPLLCSARETATGLPGCSQASVGHASVPMPHTCIAQPALWQSRCGKVTGCRAMLLLHRKRFPSFVPASQCVW